MLKNMELIRVYPAGSLSSATSTPQGLIPVNTNKWPVHIYYDPIIPPPPPQLPILSCATRLLAATDAETSVSGSISPQMLLPVKSSGVPGVAMLDTGAGDVFCRAPYATAVGAKIIPCPHIRIKLADDDTTCHGHVQTQNYPSQKTHHLDISLCAARIGKRCRCDIG